jgi:ATP-dependent Clp protease protease subunit
MEDESSPADFEVSEGMIFSRQAVTNSILQKLIPKEKPIGTPIDVAKATPAEWLEKRLNLLKP